MEQLSKWHKNYHELLQQRFEEKHFSRTEAISALGVTANTADDILSTLARSGYIFKEKQKIDQRESLYRLVDLGEVQSLQDRLEARRQTKQDGFSLPKVIDSLWKYVRHEMAGYVDLSDVPSNMSDLIESYLDKRVKLADLKIVKNDVVKSSLKELEKRNQDHAIEVLKIFDASSNAYRSITNVWLEYLKLGTGLEDGSYELGVSRYVNVNGVPLDTPNTANKTLCPICGRFKQTHNALAMITGNPKTDSRFQTYRNSIKTRSSMKICSYCFMAGWVDLPTTKIVKDGQTINKGRDYLFVTSPLSKERLQRLLDLIAEHGNRVGGGGDSAESDDEESSDDEKPHEFDPLTLELAAEFDVPLTDSLAVLGLSTRRLRELNGFVLQGSNQLQRTLILRVPIERMVGEEKISGAVRRELLKATMYDFRLITGGSLHYNQIVENVSFSADGYAIGLDDMYRANCAYRIADRYARVGKYRQLNSPLFMLLLTDPRHAANRILNAKKREKGGRFAPGNQKVKEIIQMTEEITKKEDDWQFQLGLRVVETLVEIGLAKRAKGFWETQTKQYSGVDLIKWIQRIKMIHNSDSARAWGTSLINGYRREHGRGANTEVVGQILALVEEIIATCQAHDMPLVEFGRTIANMDYYLLFYYNHNNQLKKESA